MSGKTDGMNAEEQRVDYAVVENVGWVRPEAVTHQQRAILRPLGEVVKPTRPRVKPSDKPNLPFIGMEHIEAHTMRLLGTVPASTMKSSAVHFQPDDVLYGRLRPYLNKVYRPDFEGLCSAEFIVFPKTGGIDSRYLQHFLNSSAFVSYASHLNAGDRPRVDFEQLAQYPFPVAPLDQQKRIVAEIEKQFSRLDEAVANLKRVKANLKRYKAAVLKAAVEGKLTEAWRKQHPDTEPASELLQRILAERRAKWEQAELAKMKAKGKSPKDDAWKNKYPEPTVPDTTNLPELPEGWVCASPDQLSEFEENSICAGPFGTIFKAKDFRPSGVPIIFLRHVAPGRYLKHKPGFMDENKWMELFQPYSVYGGELLITKLGEPPGVCAIYPEGVGPAMVTPDVIKMSVNISAVLPRYLMHYFNSEIARQFSSGAAFGTTRLRLTIPIFRGMSIPLPPIKEQHVIVAEIDRRLSISDEAEAQVNANLQRAERMRQSILSYAFSTGKLH